MTRRGWRARAVLLAATLASGVQLATLIPRGSGSDQPYFADYDEFHYGAALRQAARLSVPATNPYDRAGRDAASPFGWMLPYAAAFPLRLGFPVGFWVDAERWGGSFATALLLVELGALAAAPEVGAAAAALVLLDPATYSGKPLASILGVGVIAGQAWPHQLPYARLYSPSFTFPFFALALLAWWRLAARPRRRVRRVAGAVAFGLLGASAYTFLWASGVAAACGCLWRRKSRSALWAPLVASVGLLVVVVALNALGRRDEGLTGFALRIGFFRTHAPPFLRHVGFWLGALGAAWLGFARWPCALGARLLGRGALAVWLLAMLLTPLTGWNIQSHHFSYALGPLFTLVWCTIAWYAWRRLGRRRSVALAGWALVGWCGLAGPSWALLGAGSFAAADAAATSRQLQRDLAVAAIRDGSLVLVPRGMRGVLAGTTNHLAFAHEYLHLWAVADSVIWDRQTCAAVLTGEDSAAVVRAIVPREPGQPIWGWGRPPGFPMAGVRSYNDVAPRLGALAGHTVAAARRDARLLAAACAEHPDFVLAVGPGRVRRAVLAAAALGGRVRAVAADSSRVWLEFPRRSAARGY